MANEFIMTFDANTGAVQEDDSFPRGDVKDHNKPVKNKKRAKKGVRPKGQIKKVIPCAIVLYKKNPNCITFVIGGELYTYCF